MQLRNWTLINLIWNSHKRLVATVLDSAALDHMLQSTCWVMRGVYPQLQVLQRGLEMCITYDTTASVQGRLLFHIHTKGWHYPTFIYLFFWERVRAHMHMCDWKGRGQGRGRERKSLADVTPSVVPHMGHNLMTRRPWPELKSGISHLTNWNTQMPMCYPYFLTLSNFYWILSFGFNINLPNF